MNESKKTYELYFLLDPNWAEKEPENTLPTYLESQINKLQGKILKTSPVQKIRLAYPIKKQTQGFSGTLDFEIDSQNIEALKRNLRDPKVLRFMMVARKTPALTYQVKAPRTKLTEELKVREPEAKEPESQVKEEKTFAQKLEQILRGH